MAQRAGEKRPGLPRLRRLALQHLSDARQQRLELEGLDQVLHAHVVELVAMLLVGSFVLFKSLDRYFADVI